MKKIAQKKLNHRDVTKYNKNTQWSNITENQKAKKK